MGVLISERFCYFQFTNSSRERHRMYFRMVLLTDSGLSRCGKKKFSSIEKKSKLECHAIANFLWFVQVLSLCHGCSNCPKFCFGIVEQQ